MAEHNPLEGSGPLRVGIISILVLTVVTVKTCSHSGAQSLAPGTGAERRRPPVLPRACPLVAAQWTGGLQGRNRGGRIRQEAQGGLDFVICRIIRKKFCM